MPTKNRSTLTQWLIEERRRYPEASGDLNAAIIIAVTLIPQGMAYSILAGNPPIYGLYTASVGRRLGKTRTVATGAATGTATGADTLPPAPRVQIPLIVFALLTSSRIATGPIAPSAILYLALTQSLTSENWQGRVSSAAALDANASLCAAAPTLPRV